MLDHKYHDFGRLVGERLRERGRSIERERREHFL
jgi:hypothetical protein